MTPQWQYAPGFVPPPGYDLSNPTNYLSPYEFGKPGQTVPAVPGLPYTGGGNGPVAPAVPPALPAVGGTNAGSHTASWDQADPCSGDLPFWVMAECRLTQLLDIGLWNVGLLALAGVGIYLALRPEINRAVKTGVKAAAL